MAYSSSSGPWVSAGSKNHVGERMPLGEALVRYPDMGGAIRSAVEAYERAVQSGLNQMQSQTYRIGGVRVDVQGNPGRHDNIRWCL